MADSISFVLPNLTLFSSRFLGDKLSNYDAGIRKALGPEYSGSPYQIIPARLSTKDPETEITSNDTLSSYSGRRLLIRCANAPSVKISIFIQNVEANERIPYHAEPSEQLKKIIAKVKKRWKAASALTFNGVAVDDRLAIRDIGIVGSETLTIVERVKIILGLPGQSKTETVRIPTRLSDLNGLFDFLSGSLKFELPSRKLVSSGITITDIAQVYALPEDSVLVFEVDTPKIELAVQVRYRLVPEEEKSVEIAVSESPTIGQLREVIIQRPEFSGRLFQILTDDQPADDSTFVHGHVDVRFGVQVQLLHRKRTIWLFQNPALTTVDALLSHYSAQYGVPRDSVTATQTGQTVAADTPLIALKSDTPVILAGLDSPTSGGQFRFLLPDGTVDIRSLDDTRTIASLISEFPNLPTVQFFDGDEPLDGSARVVSLPERRLITVRIVYEFMCRHWEEPRAKAFADDTTVGEAASELTGKSANEFIVTYSDNPIPPSDLLSSVEYAKGQPFILIRVFPIKFQIEGSDQIFAHRFSDDCTFHVMKEILARDHVGFDPVFHPDWVNEAEIYAVLDLSEIIVLRKIPDPEESVDPPEHHAPAGLETREYEFRYLDDGSAKSIAIPVKATVKEVARSVGRDHKHAIKLYLNHPGSALPRNDVLSNIVPEKSAVFVEICQVVYSLVRGAKTTEIQLPDSATFRDLRQPALAAFFPEGKIGEGQLRFILRSAKGEKKIKSSKEAQTILLDFWRPDLAILVEVQDPSYSFRVPGETDKLRKVPFSIETHITAVHAYWEQKLGFPVQLSIGDKRLPSSDTPIINVPGLGRDSVISVARAIQKRIKVKQVVRMPGHSELFVIQLDDRETAGKFLSRLTYDTSDHQSISIEGSGERINVMKVRVVYGGRELDFDERLASLSGGRTESDPLEVVTFEHHFTFVFGNESFQERIEPGQTIPAVEFFLSRRLRQEIEIVADDVYVISGMLFEDLAEAIADAKQPSIQLQKAVRRLYLFGDYKQAEKRYFRFDDFTKIREVKTVVCPDARFRHVRLIYRGQELSDSLAIGEIPDFDPREALYFSRRRKDVVEFVEDDGTKLSIVLEGRKRRLDDIKRELAGSRDIELHQLGEEVKELKPTRRLPVRISCRTSTFTFSNGGQTTTRELPKSATLSSIRSSFAAGGADSQVFFAIDGVLQPLDAPLSLLPPTSTITVLKVGPTQDVARTVGDLRAADPSARDIYRSGDRILVNSVPLFTVGKLSKEPSTPRPPRRFGFLLPFVPARPELSNAVRAFCFDYEATVRDAREVLTDVTRLCFPHYALYYRGHLLADSEFLFDIGYTDSEPIRVRLPLGGAGEVRVIPGGLKPGVSVVVQPDDTVHDVKGRLTDECDLPPDIELVSQGKVLQNEDQIDAEQFPRTSCVWMYARIDEEIIAEAPEVVTTFEFLITRTHARLALPFVETKTVREAKFELSKKLLKPVLEIAIIDLAELLLLQDGDLLAKYQKGKRPFNIHFVDSDQELAPDQVRLIQKCMPGKNVETEGKDLFLACAGNTRVFQKTCKTRGLM